jgi:iron-sulfur cluster repair protein YtfE (RIC family)
VSKARRHESLIPLSREHHYGLMLCLRINRGLPAHSEEAAWLQSKAQQATKFFEDDLTQHFEAEESVLFPSMQGIPAAILLMDELLLEHRELEELVRRLREADVKELAGLLTEFATLLESHIRKEERILFPIYEREVAPDVAARVEREILSVIGTAIQPKHPELLDP